MEACGPDPGHAAEVDLASEEYLVFARNPPVAGYFDAGKDPVG